MNIHQLTAGFSTGDAISNEVVQLQRAFRRWGCRSEVFFNPQYTNPAVRARGYDYRAYDGQASADDLMIFHFSVGSRVTEAFARWPCHKAIVYHNITPPEYYAAVDPRTSRLLADGLDELRRLASVVEIALADSAFNERGLVDAGYRPTAVLPLLLDFSLYEREADAEMMARLGDGTTNLLFVGRLAPNKRFEDVIRVFAIYQKTVQPRSRLVLVGSYSATDRYCAFLKGVASELDARNVVFTGHLTQEELNACYRTAHALVCMSEHEGFCIPLVEAMAFGVPIVAYAVPAVQETLGGCGVLVHEKDLPLVAETLHEVIANRALRDAIVAKQRARLDAFRPDRIEALLRTHLAPWLNAPYPLPEEREFGRMRSQPRS